MALTIQQLESSETFQKLNPEQREKVARKVLQGAEKRAYYNAYVRPRFKGQGTSEASKSSLIQWGMADPVSAPPEEISGFGEGVAQGFGRYLFDEGPTGQAKRYVARKMAEYGIEDADVNPLSPTFGQVIDRGPGGRTFPNPVLPVPGSPAEAGLAVGGFTGMLADPTNKLIIGKGMKGLPAAAGPMAKPSTAYLAGRAAAGFKQAAPAMKSGAMTAGAIGAGTAALRQANEGQPVDSGEILAEGLGGALLGGGIMGAMGAARGLGGPTVREFLSGRTPGLDPFDLRLAQTPGLVPAGPVRPTRTNTPIPEEDVQAAFNRNAAAFMQRGGDLDGPMMSPGGFEPNTTALVPSGAINVPPGGFAPPRRIPDALTAQFGELAPPVPRAEPLAAPPEPGIFPAPPRVAGLLPERGVVNVPPGGFPPPPPSALTSKFGEPFIGPRGPQGRAAPMTPEEIAAAQRGIAPPSIPMPKPKKAASPKAQAPESGGAPMETLPAAGATEAPAFRRGDAIEFQSAKGDWIPALVRADAAPGAKVPIAYGDGVSSALPADRIRPAQVKAAVHNGAAASVLKMADALEAQGQSIIKNTRGRLRSGFDVDALAGHSMVLAARLMRGGVKFGTWAKEMVAEHGEAIAPHLRRIWDDAQAHVRRAKPPGVPVDRDPVPMDGTAEGGRAKAGPIVDDLAANPPAPSGAKYAGSINLDNLGTAKDVGALIETVAREYQGEITHARRGVVPHEVTSDLADQLGMTVADVLKMKRGEAFKSAVHGKAARDILHASGERLGAKLDAYDPGKTSAEEKLALVDALRLHAAIQAKVSGAISESARTVNAFRMTAKSRAGQLKQLNEMVDQLGGAENIDKAIQAAKDLSGPARAKFIREMNKPNFWRAVEEYYVNSLISAPPTWLANVVGPAAAAGLKLAETLAASAVGTVTRRKGVYAGEAKANIAGMSAAWHEALDLSRRTFKGEQNLAPGTSMAEVFEPAIPGKVGEVIRTPGRITESTDVYFKTLLQRGDLYGRAYRQAAREGLKSRALEARVSELVENPPVEMFDASVDASRYYTFTQALNDKGPFRVINNAGRAVLAFKRNTPGAGIPAPFVRTPANLTTFAAERTPLAMGSKVLWRRVLDGFAKDATPEQMAEMNLTLGRLAVGTITMSQVVNLARNGTITGNGPSDPREAAALRATGWQPQSVFINGKYYSYARFDPLATPVALAADLATIDKYGRPKDAAQTAYAVLESFTNNLAEKTYFQSFANFALALTDPGRYMPKYLGTMAGGFIPSIANKAGQAMDTVDGKPVDREVDDDDPLKKTANYARKRIPPGLPYGRDTLPEKLDDFGQPVTSDMGPLETFLSPGQRREDKNDATLDELARLGKTLPGAPSDLTLDESTAVKLTPELQQAYMKLVGPASKKLLDVVVQSPGYQAIPSDDDKRDAIDYFNRKIRQELREQFVAQNADAIRRILQQTQTAPAPAGVSP